MDKLDRLRRLAELQHGVVADWQLRSLDYDWHRVSAWLANGRLVRLGPRALCLTGAPPTALRKVAAGLFDAGPAAIVSHTSAAWLWRLPGCDLGRVEVTRLRGLAQLDATVAGVHRPKVFLPHHVTTVDGLAVTSLARTLFDLAGVFPPARMERLIDTVVTRGPGMLEVLHEALDELARRGRPGSTTMRRLLRTRPVGAAVVASGLEARFEAILRRAGLPGLDRQVDVGGHSWIGRVDFCDRALGILVEVDSVAHHTSVIDTRLDGVRDEALLAAGWSKVVRVKEAEIWHQPWVVVEKVRAARRALAA